MRVVGREAVGAQPAVGARLFSRLGLEREENISWKPRRLWTFFYACQKVPCKALGIQEGHC